MVCHGHIWQDPHKKYISYTPHKLIHPKLPTNTNLQFADPDADRASVRSWTSRFVRSFEETPIEGTTRSEMREMERSIAANMAPTIVVPGEGIDLLATPKSFFRDAQGRGIITGGIRSGKEASRAGDAAMRDRSDRFASTGDMSTSKGARRRSMRLAQTSPNTLGTAPALARPQIQSSPLGHIEPLAEEDEDDEDDDNESEEKDDVAPLPQRPAAPTLHAAPQPPPPPPPPLRYRGPAPQSQAYRTPSQDAPSTIPPPAMGVGSNMSASPTNQDTNQNQTSTESSERPHVMDAIHNLSLDEQRELLESILEMERETGGERRREEAMVRRQKEEQERLKWADRSGHTVMEDSPLAVLKRNQREYARYIQESIAEGIPPSDAFDSRETRWHIPSQWQAMQRARRREFDAYRREQKSALFYSGETDYAEKLVEREGVGKMPSLNPMLDAALEEHRAMQAIDDKEVRRQAVNGILSLTNHGRPVDEMVMGYTRGGAGVRGGKPLAKLSESSRRRRSTMLESGDLGRRMLSVGAVGSATDRTEATTKALLHGTLGDVDDDEEVRSARHARRHGDVTVPAGPETGEGTWRHEHERLKFYNEAKARALRATLERTREFSIDGGSPLRVTSSAKDARRAAGISAEVLADQAIRADGRTHSLALSTSKTSLLSPEDRAAHLARTQKVLKKRKSSMVGDKVVGGVGFAESARRASKVVPRYAVRPRHGRGLEESPTGDIETPRFDARRGSLATFKSKARRTSLTPTSSATKKSFPNNQKQLPSVPPPPPPPPPRTKPQKTGREILEELLEK